MDILVWACFQRMVHFVHGLVKVVQYRLSVGETVCAPVAVCGVQESEKADYISYNGALYMFC